MQVSPPLVIDMWSCWGRPETDGDGTDGEGTIRREMVKAEPGGGLVGLGVISKNGGV